MLLCRVKNCPTRCPTSSDCCCSSRGLCCFYPHPQLSLNTESPGLLAFPLQRKRRCYSSNPCRRKRPSRINPISQKLALLTGRPSNRPPVLPSFPGSADTSISCSSLSSCLSRPSWVDSSSVSRHGGALRRHGQWSAACSLSADGQAAILSRAGLRSKFSFHHRSLFYLLPDLLQLPASHFL